MDSFPLLSLIGPIQVLLFAISFYNVCFRLSNKSWAALGSGKSSTPNQGMAKRHETIHETCFEATLILFLTFCQTATNSIKSK